MKWYQGCNKGQKSGGAGSNAARRRCPAAPSDLPKSGGAAAPPGLPPCCMPVQYYNSRATIKKLHKKIFLASF